MRRRPLHALPKPTPSSPIRSSVQSTTGSAARRAAAGRAARRLGRVRPRAGTGAAAGGAARGRARRARAAATSGRRGGERRRRGTTRAGTASARCSATSCRRRQRPLAAALADGRAPPRSLARAATAPLELLCALTTRGRQVSLLEELAPMEPEGLAELLSSTDTAALSAELDSAQFVVARLEERCAALQAELGRTEAEVPHSARPHPHLHTKTPTPTTSHQPPNTTKHHQTPTLAMRPRSSLGARPCPRPPPHLSSVARAARLALCSRRGCGRRRHRAVVRARAAAGGGGAPGPACLRARAAQPREGAAHQALRAPAAASIEGSRRRRCQR